MNKKLKTILSIAVLCIVFFSVSFAWFRNNQSTDVSSSDSISIKGNGVMQTAYATTPSGTDIPASGASYSSQLKMQLNGKYMDTSGDGLTMYTAALDSNGTPKSDGWGVAEVDTAVSSSDSGQYVVADIYFKSDNPMDIYLQKDASVTPVSNSNGNDLVNKGSYSGYTLFSEFSNGLPALNINQSGYGLFSRNLIAGATRVSFSEYTYSTDWVAPEYANVVWVPNSTYQLTHQTDLSLLDTMTLTGTKETTYSYYQTTGNYTITRVDGDLSGKLSIKKTSGSTWEDVTDRMVSLDSNNYQLIPTRVISGASDPIPQIWASTQFVDAAYCKSLDRFVKAEYASNNNINDYALITTGLGGTVYVRETADGYEKYVKDSSGSFVSASPQVLYTDETQIANIEAGFTRDSAEYQCTYWIEEDDFIGNDEISRCKIGSTKDIDGSGVYYTRIKITIWVEGYDRESNIALNSGEFNVNLKFFGVENSSN